MPRRRIICLAGALALASCFGPRAPQVRSFSLALPRADLGGTSAHPEAPVVRVRDLEAAPIVDRDLLVVRQSPVELDLRPELRWDERPHRVLANHLARSLLARGLASSAPRDLGDGRPALELGGLLEVFEHDRSGGKSVARLALVLQVKRFEDGQLRARTHVALEQPCAADPAAAVAALSSLAGQAATKALDALDQQGAFAPTAEVAPRPAKRDVEPPTAGAKE